MKRGPRSSSSFAEIPQLGSDVKIQVLEKRAAAVTGRVHSHARCGDLEVGRHDIGSGPVFLRNEHRCSIQKASWDNGVKGGKAQC